MIWRSVLSASCAMCLACTVHAAVTISDEFDIAPAGGGLGAAYNPTFPSGSSSATDLINGLAPSASSGTFTLEAAAGVSALTNGVVTTYYGDGTGASNHTEYATAGDGGGAGTSVTYALPGGKYDLSSIVIYGGWNDGGRDQQNYNVQTSTDGVLFTTLATTGVVNHGVQGTDTTPITTRLAFTENALPNLAAGVSHVRVNFLAVENGYAGYSEIDVFGSRVVPEPGTIALASLAALGVVALRRRRA